MPENFILCYGEIGVDNIILVDQMPAPELGIFPTGDTLHIGGAAANTAAWLARWDVPARLAGNAIGYDDYGSRLWRWLSQHPALDLSLVERREDVTTPFCRILVTPDAERSVLIFGYPQAPKTALTREMLAGAKFLALDLYGGEERIVAARVAREAGVQTVITDMVALDHPALPATSIACNSAAYIRDAYPDVDEMDHARRLQQISGGIIVLTNGPHPVRVLDRDGGIFSVQPPPAEAVDATGAGDAFRAGLMAGLLHGEALDGAVAWGAAAGALKVQHVGAASTIPALEDVRALAAGLAIEWL